MSVLTVDDLAMIGDGNPANGIARVLFSDGSIALLQQRHLYALGLHVRPLASDMPAHKASCPECDSPSGWTCIGLGMEHVHVERLMNGLRAGDGD